MFIFTFIWWRVIRNCAFCVHRVTGRWRDSRWTVRVSPRSYLVSPIFRLLAWWPGSPPSLRRPGRSAGRALCSRHSGACCVHLTPLRERWVRGISHTWPVRSLHLRHASWSPCWISAKCYVCWDNIHICIVFLVDARDVLHYSLLQSSIADCSTASCVNSKKPPFKISVHGLVL